METERGRLPRSRLAAANTRSFSIIQVWPSGVKVCTGGNLKGLRFRRSPIFLDYDQKTSMTTAFRLFRHYRLFRYPPHDLVSDLTGGIVFGFNRLAKMGIAMSLDAFYYSMGDPF